MNPLRFAQKYKNYARQVRNDIMRQNVCMDRLACTTSDIRQVILILSTSRGGSSLLFHLLAQSGQLLSLAGEHVPYYKLNGFSAFESDTNSDEIVDGTSGDLSGLSRDIIAGLGTGPELSQVDIEEFAVRLALHLPLQWPQLQISAEELFSYIRRAYKTFYECHTQWDSTAYLLLLLHLVCSNHPEINPYYYDLDVASYEREKHLLGCKPFLGPPDPYYCLEEPPFIVIRPRMSPTNNDIREKPLLLKASVDVYRMPLLRTLFPNAEFKIIHLIRNPAASINGLYDGWLDRGFYSYNLANYDHRLAIPGYSDRYSWGQYWWNFDLPPKWEELANIPLEYVCGFQWLSSHKAIINNLAHFRHDSMMRICFEDIIHSAFRRCETMDLILRFIGIDMDAGLQSIIQQLPVVMPTKPPTINRWLARKEVLLPVLAQTPMKEMLHELGYTLTQFERAIQ